MSSNVPCQRRYTSLVFEVRDLDNDARIGRQFLGNGPVNLCEVRQVLLIATIRGLIVRQGIFAIGRPPKVMI